VIFLKKKKKLRLKKEVIYLFLFLIPLPLLILSCIKIYSWLNDAPKTESIIKYIEENTTIEEYSSEDAIIIESEEHPDTPYWNYIKMDLLDVKFSDLESINDETVAWIKVPGTNVNYPVVQTSDNDYYLNHSFDKSNNDAGWLFMDFRNNKNEYEKNTIIYGHNRKDKTMFGSLEEVLTSEWYKNVDNRVMKMSSRTNNTLWQIFSIYVIETTNDYIKTIFNTDTEFQDFINLIKSRSYTNFNTNVTSNDKVLTLSTCHGNTKKLVIHAKLIKIENK